MKTKLFVLIGLMLSLVACNQAPEARDQYDTRFAFERYEPSSTQCVVHVVTDRQTGCQYLQICNDVTSMPHTCILDRALTEKVLGVPN